MADDESNRQAAEMQKPMTAQTAHTTGTFGFKLPPPTGVSATSTGFKLPPPTAAGQDAEYQASQQSEWQEHGTQAPLPPPSGYTGDASQIDDGSGMFTFSRPGTRAGHSNSSYYAAPGSRMGTGMGSTYDAFSQYNGMHGRPLTAFAIPEEQAGFEQSKSPAAAVAAAYREGRAIPPSRGSLGTPVIELEDRMRSATDRPSTLGEHDGSSPSGSDKTGFDPDGHHLYEGVDADEMYKAEQNAEAFNESAGELFEEEEDSPYPEVRASVSNFDDPDMPCLTFRAILLGIIFTLLGAALNTYFILRYPAPLVTPIVIQIVSYPFGVGLASILPVTIRQTPKIMQKLGMDAEWSLNPGPFNIKEHTVIIIMANVGIVPTYGPSLLLAFDKFYGVQTGFGFDILLLLSTNVIGFSFAGLCRRFLIWPAALIWPQSLVTCTLLNTFHAEDDDAASGSITRYRYFSYVFIGALVWYIVPGYLFVGLSAFSWVCWIAPENPVVNQLFGVASGLGMSGLTFDWSQIAYIGSPLVVPWWSIANIFVGFVVLYWIFAPAMYYTNTWDMAYLPISVNGLFDRYGAEYNVSAVISPDFSLNEEAYESYSPLFFPTTYATVYCLGFALATASVVHTALYYGPNMWKTFKDIKNAQTDIHAKLMLAYREVPTWWYLITFVICMALSLGFIEGYHTGLPVWGLILSLVVVAVYIIPAGYIYALASQAMPINVIAETIPGYLFKGQPVVNMIFKAFSVNAMNNGLFYIQDLKLGHYMKVPPRTTFAVQMLATVLASFVQAGMKEGFLKIPDLCSADQEAKLSCPLTRTIANSSVIWGLIGPERIFGRDSPYNAILWSLLVGAVVPLIFYLFSRRFKASWLQMVNIPVMLSGAAYIPPASGINYSSWFLAGFIFQYLLRRVKFRWWSKFCFITSAALDSGTVISTILVFFILQLPKGGALRLNWWGNTVYRETYDWMGYPYRIPPEEGFGRTVWH